jgi:hypothetical protein
MAYLLWVDRVHFGRHLYMQMQPLKALTLIIIACPRDMRRGRTRHAYATRGGRGDKTHRRSGRTLRVQAGHRNAVPDHDHAIACKAPTRCDKPINKAQEDRCSLRPSCGHTRDGPQTRLASKLAANRTPIRAAKTHEAVLKGSS